MNELEQVEIQIDTAKRMIVLRDTLVKLTKNKQFKDVIETAYFKEEAARLVMAKSAPLDEQQQRTVDGMILGVGALAGFFEMIMRRGADMDATLADHEEAREEILAEEIG